MSTKFNVSPDERASELSPRLNETLQCLLDGASEKNIADQLKLSPHTVHGYVKLIYRHFQVKSRRNSSANRSAPPSCWRWRGWWQRGRNSRYWDSDRAGDRSNPHRHLISSCRNDCRRSSALKHAHTGDFLCHRPNPPRECIRKLQIRRSGVVHLGSSGLLRS